MNHELFPNFKDIHTVKFDFLFLLSKKNASAVNTFAFFEVGKTMFFMRFYNMKNFRDVHTHLDNELYISRTDYSLVKMREFYRALRADGFQPKTFNEVLALID
jgi:hypothetical protein